jgi:hemolysin activation/secretion protein
MIRCCAGQVIPPQQGIHPGSWGWAIHRPHATLRSTVGAGSEQAVHIVGVTVATTFRPIVGIAVSLVGLLATQTWAQTSTPPPGAVPTPEQLRPPLPAARPGTVPPELPAVPRELGKPSDEIALDVTSYTVDASAPAQLRAALPALTAAFVGKQRSYEDMVNAAGAVTRYLQREMGFYLGYAYLPEQTPVGGVVRIAVLEGRLDEVILNWPEKMPIERGVVESYLARLKPGEILRVRDVERIVFLVNDLRGITARFEVKSGRTPGTASLVVTPQPEDRIVSRAEFDTSGSRYSGVARASWLSTISSPLGRGDGLVLNALSTTTRGLIFGLAGYTLPVGSDGLKVGASLSLVRYELDKEELPLGLKGDAATVTLYSLYPVIRSRNLNLFALVSLDGKQFNDRTESTGLETRKRATDLQLSISGDARDDLLSGGVNTYELSVIHGRMTSSRPLPSDIAANYTLVRANASRLQNITSNRLLFYASLKGQLATKNLDSTEQFQLGGPDRVRAFAPGEGTGDTGLVLSLELRYLPPEDWFGRVARELVFSAFYDTGRIKFKDTPLALAPGDDPVANTSTLSGWGIGAVWDRPRDFALRAYLAWPSGGVAVNDTVVKKPRVYLTANKTF